ncbi:hypothetical protein V8C43DRAFT_274466 [Trichoderma afarasin]
MLFLESYERSKERRADNGAKARCKLSSRPAIAAILNSAPPSEVRQCLVMALYIALRPQPNCAYSAIKLASFFPAVQESKNCSP